MHIHNRLALTAAMAASIFLGACSSTPVAPAANANNAANQSTAPATSSTAPAAMTSAPIAPYLDPQNALYKERSVYFDFDQSIVKPENSRLMELHGKYLASNPSVAIKIEGNTDEQGGAEYNLALGQKRAEAVVKSLTIYGAAKTQMEAVSFGSEKPKALAHDEAAHAQNRRADLAYPTR
jgi:peptidoglycan-associated lipoprotein